MRHDLKRLDRGTTAAAPIATVERLEGRIVLAALQAYPIAPVELLDQSFTPPLFGAAGYAYAAGKQALVRSDGSTAGTMRIGNGYSEKLFNWNGTLYLRYYETSPGGSSVVT